MGAVSCQRDEPYYQEDIRNPVGKTTLVVPEDVMVYMEFKSKATMVIEPAEHVDQSKLTADQQHVVISGRVPMITEKRQIFQIMKDKSYRLVIETLEPKSNPARVAFRGEVRMNDWELKRIIIDPNKVTAYDLSGQVIFTAPNDDKIFSRLIDKLFSDPDFAQRVNIGNALFRLSGGTENYLDPKLRSFFVSGAAKYSTRDGLTVLEERLVDQLQMMGLPLPAPKPPVISAYDPSQGDKDQTHTPEETFEMIKGRVEEDAAQRDASQLKTYTVMDSTENKIAAEATYAGEEQVLAVTFYEVADDPQRTIKTEYTEKFGNNRAHDLDVVTKVSTEYSDVHIVDKFKTLAKDEK